MTRVRHAHCHVALLPRCSLCPCAVPAPFPIGHPARHLFSHPLAVAPHAPYAPPRQVAGHCRVRYQCRVLSRTCPRPPPEQVVKRHLKEMLTAMEGIRGAAFGIALFDQV